MGEQFRSRRAETSVDQAIERVLAAEREANKAIEECRQQARSLASRARARSRRILERADERIGGLRARSDPTVNKTIAELEAQMHGLSGEPTLDDEQLARVERGVRILAAEITGVSK